MDGIIYLTLDQAKAIHAKTIQYSGGGITEPLDTGKLESVLVHIQNDDYYPTFIDKLTHLFFCTCEFHCFADGNKRLAITLSAQFLLFNGYMSVAKNFFAITENIWLNSWRYSSKPSSLSGRRTLRSNSALLIRRL